MQISGGEQRWFEALYRLPSDSHKGQNGRLLVLGGSKLFHASIFWSAQVASKIVDLVHFSSPALENNELARQKAKMGFWEGIVVPFEDLEAYIEEDDALLIGPGMPREEGLFENEQSTAALVNRLVQRFPKKRWVVDGGALQEIEPQLLTESMVITPHQGEWQRLLAKMETPFAEEELFTTRAVQWLAKETGCTVLLKGKVDIAGNAEEVIEISGGNEGLTKGGTGDVLAGVLAALYCKNEALVAAVTASAVLKRTGEVLFEKVGPFYNAGDVVAMVPEVMKEVYGY